MTGDADAPRRAPRPEPSRADERAVSTAVTHVLAIGITTILISGLLVAAAGLLTGQQDNAGRTQLQEIGNRVAEQVYVASTTVNESASTDAVTIRLTSQPDRVAGYTYTVALEDGSECTGIDGPPGVDPDGCLVLDPAPGLNIRDVKVPVDVEGDPSEYDEVSVENTGSGELVVRIEA